MEVSGRKRGEIAYVLGGLAIGIALGVGYLAFQGRIVTGKVAGVSKVDVKTQKMTRLGEEVEKSLAGTTGTYSAIIKNFKTGEEYRRNGDRKYLSASLYKLWVMAAVFKEIERGGLDPDKKLSASISSLNSFFGIPTSEAELTSGSVNLTVKSATRQMIAISHNYAAMMLVKEIGIEKVRTMTEELGLSNTSVGGDEAETTPEDVANFLEKLHEGKIVSASASAEMVGLLLEQEKKEVIPKYLPGNTKLAHKTGELEWVKHDAGIVFSPQGDYLIVLMSESNLPGAAAERMARISGVVYKYFGGR